MTGLWYSRPRAALCAAIAVLAVSAAFIARESFGNRRSASRCSYAIVQRYYGMDARELERTVAVPLEDALSALPGAQDIATTSEYGMVRASVRFFSNPSSSYEGVRSAAQRVYETLPRAAQRPEIYSADTSRAPVWIAAVTASSDLDRLLERELKPAFERVEGVGEVELAGTGMPEVAVLVDEEKAASAGGAPLAAARFLSENDGLFSAGTVSDEDNECPVIIDARYPSIERLKKALIPFGSQTPILLGSVARISERSRQNDSRSRVNGKSAAVVSITAGSNADIAALSRSLSDAVHHEEARLSSFAVSFRVLSDRGAEREASFRSVLNAALQGACVVAAVTAALAAGAALSVKIAAALTVPFVLAVSSAVLVSAGFPLDRLSLAGLAAGLGAAVDAAILTVERVGTVRDPRKRAAQMRTLAPPLIAGAATTLATLIPIASMEPSIPGSAVLAWSVGSTTVVALLAAFFVLPALSGRALPRGAQPSTYPALRGIASSFVRTVRRLLAYNAIICARKAWVVIVSAAFLVAAASISLAAVGTDVGGETEGNAVYAHLEFERGSTMGSADKRLADWGAELAGMKGVLNVQTSAKSASGSALVTFDPRTTDRNAVSAAMRACPLPGGFVFLPEATEKDRLWELSVTGDDDRVCRELAEKAAAALGNCPLVKDVVLNFKDGPERLVVSVDHEKLSRAGLSFSAVADAVRRSVYGPPAYKRLDGSGEIDVRVSALREGETSPSSLLRIPIASRAGTVLLGELATTRREGDVSRIIRKDRRPVASVTVRTDPIDPRRVEQASLAAVREIDLPPLYAFEFDREALASARRISGVVLLFFVAALLSYLALAAVTESFTAPLVALAAVPPSLAVPAIASALSAGSVSAVCASSFVAVSGMAVNAAVLIVDERRSGGACLPSASARSLYRLTRSHAAPLAASCAVTVLGSLPLLFLPGAGNAAARQLAFVSVFGISASFIASLTLVPAFAVSCPRMFDTFLASAIARGLPLAMDGPYAPARKKETFSTGRKK